MPTAHRNTLQNNNLMSRLPFFLSQFPMPRGVKLGKTGWKFRCIFLAFFGGCHYHNVRNSGGRSLFWRHSPRKKRHCDGIQ